jgi:hypothetical protein
MIDTTDLRPIKMPEALEGRVIGHFYLKDEKGNFVACQVFKEELRNEARATLLMHCTLRYCSEGRLYTRINRPFKSFQ